MPIITLTGAVYRAHPGEVWPYAEVVIELLEGFALDGDDTAAPGRWKVTADASGEIDADVLVPPEGTAPYRIWLPKDKKEYPPYHDVHWGAADTPTLADVEGDAYSDPSPVPGGGLPDAYDAIVAPSDGDYETLADAISAGKSYIYLAPGTYTATNATITIDGTIIQGAGAEAVTLVAAADGPALTVDAADVTIRGITIDGNSAAQSGTYSAIAVGVTAHRLLVEDSTIMNAAEVGYCIRNTAANDVVTRRLKIIGGATDPNTPTVSSYGIYHIGTIERPIIEDCYFEGLIQPVGLWYGVSGGRVRNNVLIDNYGYLDAAGGSSNSRSAIEVYGAAAYADHTDNWVTGNYIDGSTASCIELATGSPRTRIIGNTMINHGASGYGNPVGITGSGTEPSTDCVIADNTIICNGAETIIHTGLFINGAGTDGGILERNTVIGADFVAAGTITHGLWTDAQGGKNIKIRDNSFDGCLQFLVQNLGPGSEVSGSRITGLPTDISARGGTTVFKTDSTCSGVTVRDNIIATTVTGVAAWEWSGSRLLIEGNVAATSNQTVLYAHDSIVRGNRITLSAYANQVLYVAGDRNVVEDNVLLAPSGTARSMYLASGNNVIGHNVVDTAVQNAGTGNEVATQDSATYRARRTPKALGAQTVGTSQATIAHGLGYTPVMVEITMTSAGAIWKSATSDSTNVYLTADAAGRTAEVYVR